MIAKQVKKPKLTPNQNHPSCICQWIYFPVVHEGLKTSPVSKRCRKKLIRKFLKVSWKNGASP